MRLTTHHIYAQIFLCFICISISAGQSSSISYSGQAYIELPSKRSRTRSSPLSIDQGDLRYKQTIQLLRTPSPYRASLWLPPALIIQSWDKTGPHHMQLTPDEALIVTDNFFAALHPEVRVKGYFFVQHILLTTAHLYFKKYAHNLMMESCSMPGYVNSDSRRYLETTKYFFALVDRKLLHTSALSPDTVTSALLTHRELQQQLKRAERPDNRMYR